MSDEPNDPQTDGGTASEPASKEPKEFEEHPLEWDEPENNDKAPEDRKSVSRPAEKFDDRKLVTGQAKYTADYEQRFPDLAHAAVVRSTVPHGRVTAIETDEAEEMDGVYAVLTPWSDAAPDAKYTSAGQSYPEPSPWDMNVLNEHVRYVGDPIAAVAAEDAAAAASAVESIEVEYEEYDHVVDPEEAFDEDAPQLFDDDEVENKIVGHDYDRNRMSNIEGEIGDVDAAIDRDDVHVHETEWETIRQSHAQIEKHTSLAYTDEDDRKVLVTSTQVPNHTRRQLAHLFDIPIRDIRVKKPRVGGGFGGKQAMVVEPLPLALSLAADRPVMYEASRDEEFYAMRSRHPMTVRARTAVTDDGEIEAIDLYALSNTGAYGSHGMTVAGNVGSKPMPLYSKVPNARFEADIVHTNTPQTGAMRGYGAPQGTLALEGHLDEVARDLDLDPIEFRRDHYMEVGDLDEIAGMMGGEGAERRIRSCGLDECVERGKAAIGWDELEQPAEDHLHRGIGMALSAQGTGVAGDELGAAQLMMNEDGSFHLQVGGVDIGTGADTAFIQIAAEVLGCDEDDIIVKSSDTDNTPFDYGAYASSTTYISGMAVKKAAEDAKERILDWASRMLDEPAENLETRDGEVYSEETGDAVTLEDIGYESVYGHDDREHILGKGTHSTEESPPPFAAQFVDVTVDEETGEFEVNELVVAVDCGVAINPGMAEGQVEGANHMSFEMAVSEGITVDERGRAEVSDFDQYGLPSATETPPIESILVETHEPTGPFGAKSVAEVPTNTVPPALSNAIREAVGVRINEMPITAEKIKAALEER
ncbi:aldehyde oxidase and xanthine dehydrogenase molybdopterin binding protein (plasmid) [Haloterrigena turkmenica DSM 5511]|uniref:Aldehyde oxidase and xanthine dehydrogenase molybdopterin binding protein n=1 Tax=Haloterrigena turkmenica (strain ATCC 51198 / DSM 5511 / JCM 9101 / NCIMB 13204 / VKM B-1734 / 4k) TaxID=543526 RepID=D2S0A0_HALTV|nr:molybdopterin cofactor-binding domain-containing protein [Haloterrigena turkmenica]ADB62797.1 aldehyde oxidase and xanthine dehydrogenase molybdopterin binding protein [Haloterrigena turkmenica DSM 5511]